MSLRKRNRIVAYKITPWRDPVLTVSTGTVVLEMDETANVLDEMREYIECDYIEHLRIDVKGIPFDLWFDEQGKLTHKWPSYPLLDSTGMPYDFIVGTMIVTKDDGGNIVSLSDKEIELFEDDYIKNRFKLLQ